MKTSEVLRAALDKLGPNGEHWTQGEYGRDSFGGCASLPEKATCFCGIGALSAATRSNIFPIFDVMPVGTGYLDMAVGGEYGNGSEWIEFQDAYLRSFSEVRAGFERAISLAEADEAVE